MSDVIHKTTKQVFRSVNTPDYPSDDYVIIDRAYKTANAGSVTVFDTITPKHIKVNGDGTLVEMSSGEKTTADDLTANLDVSKSKALAAIDVKTDSLIYAGEDHVAATIKTLKTAVNAAATKSAVDAVVDNR